jgi:glycosyltransferase involved in cell wall biosynthesis
MKLLSIIIPVYNVEPYIERCINSLENQDIPEDHFEIICINDGSPDNSRNVIQKTQEKHSNIVLIDQENQGVSKARNNGIEKATGKYTLFVDPDDYVEAGSFGRIVNVADTMNAEVSFLGYTNLDNEDNPFIRIFNEEQSGQLYSGLEAYFLARGDGRTDPDRMWAVLYKTEFLNRHHLRYLPDVPYLEDGEFIARILCLAERCIFEGRSFYLRTTRPGSATHSDLFHSPMSIKGFILAANNLKRFQSEKTLNDKQRYFLNQPVCKFILLALHTSLQMPYYNNYVKIRRVLITNGYKKIFLKGVVHPYTRYARIYNFIPVLFLLQAYVKEIKKILKKIISK